MPKIPPSPPEKSDQDDDTVKTQTPNENLLAEAQQMPLGLLIALATDDNVETNDGLEVKVNDVRNASDNALLTKSEMEKYDEYKRQWAATLERPQESLDALAIREKQIIEAAQNHDWEALDRLKKQVDEDIERMRYIFMGLTGGA